MTAQLVEIERVAAFVMSSPPSADVLICVPATLIERAARTAARRIAIGGENCGAEISGAFTGDISAEMVKDAGASAVITGHSERRRYHDETNLIVSAKVMAACRAGLLAIICVGETESQRSNGNAMSVVSDQLTACVPEGVTSSGIAIAYEPIWAIGTGHMPTSDQISEMHAHIRHCLAKRIGSEGRMVRILYGGSINPTNAQRILALPDVGGGLIGGASLKAAEFEAIIRCVPPRGKAESR